MTNNDGVKIFKLKNMLEAFDIAREHGRLPDNMEDFIDEIAKVVWSVDDG